MIGRLKLPAGRDQVDRHDSIRDAMADVKLRKQKGTRSIRQMIFGSDHKRLDYEGKRPIHCGNAADEDAD